jgi:hypothetical protein
MALCGEGILPLLFCNEGFWLSDRGQDARNTQGRDALATEKTIPKAFGLEAATLSYETLNRHQYRSPGLANTFLGG